MSPTLNPKDMTVKVEYQVRDAKGDFVTKADRVFDVASLPQEIRDMCLLYGISKKLADSTSSGKSLGIMGEAKLEWMQEIWKNLCEGDWNMKRAAGGAAGSVDIFLAMVVADVKGIGLEAATQALKLLTADQRKAMAEKLQDQIEAKRQAAKEAQAVDLGDLLS